MPIQSYLMMYFAGAGWQIGKRKISAIPNDQFNKMSANDLLKGFTADLRETIPTLERSLQDITPLIRILIEQYGDFVTVALKEIPQAAQDVISRQFNKEGTFAQWLIDQFKIPEAEAFAAAHREFGTDKEEVDTTLVPPPASTQIIKPFQGPEINPVTGEKSTFLTALEKAKVTPPAPHIKSRPASNVSLQSLRLEKANLEFQIRRAATNHKNALAAFNQTKNWSAAGKAKKAHVIRARSQKTGLTAGALRSAQQKFANFMKMHGSRL